MAGLLSEEDLQGMPDDAFQETSDWVSSFGKALNLLSRYPWHQFHPLKVHPDFYSVLLDEVQKRGGHQGLKRWKEVLERGSRSF